MYNSTGSPTQESQHKQNFASSIPICRTPVDSGVKKTFQPWLLASCVTLCKLHSIFVP